MCSIPYPVIILGAGASHDYIHENDLDRSKLAFQPPLTNDLLSPGMLNISHGSIDQYPGTRDLVGEINSAVRANKSFEDYLLEVRDRNPERKKQVIGFQYYLRALFQSISRGYGRQPGNNYGILVGRIKDSFGEACFVTFNYDTLLEQSLFPEEVTDIRTYTSSQYKLVKVHGSCDWLYASPINVLGKPIPQGVFQYLIDKPSRAEAISSHKDIRVEVQRSDDYPAIAIPIAGKDESGFVCPAEHTEQLIKALARTDRILVVGWAARDPRLIQLIQEHVDRPVNMYVVCGSSTNTIAAVNEKFTNVGLVTIMDIRDNVFTFSEFMNSRDCEAFMSL